MNLRPCPFCNSAAEIEHSFHEDTASWGRDYWHVRVSCTGCGASPNGWVRYGYPDHKGVPQHVYDKATEKALAAWNKRPVDPVVLQMTGTLVYLASMLDYLPHPHCVTAIDMTRESLEAAKAIFKGDA